MRNAAIAAAFLAGLLAGIGFSGRAQVSIEVLGLSRHSEPGYCERNPGLGIVYELATDLRAVAIRYKNSPCGWSTAIGVCYTPLHWGAFSFGACPTRLTGYSDKALYVPIPLASYPVAKGTDIDFVGGAWNGKAVIGAGLRFSF